MNEPIVIAAWRFVQEGNNREALQLLQDNSDVGTVLDREFVKTFAYLGLADYQNARDAAQTALAQEPASAELHFLFSKAFHGFGDYAEAEANILNAVKLEPENGLLIIYYARLVAECGQFKKAEALLRMAESLGLEHEDCAQARLHLAYLQGDKENVKKSARVIQRLDPENPAAHFILSGLAAEEGDHKALIEHLEQIEGSSGEAVKFALRDARRRNHWAFQPLRLIDRVNPATMWLAAIVVVFGLHGFGYELSAFIVAFCYLGLVVYSWGSVGILAYLDKRDRAKTNSAGMVEPAIDAEDKQERK